MWGASRQGRLAPAVLRRLALWASVLLLLAYPVVQPIAYLLVTLFEEEDTQPTFWGHVSLSIENRTQHPMVLEEVSVGDRLVFHRPRLLQPIVDPSSGHVGGLARPPGSHRVRIATRPEDDAPVLDRWFNVEVEASYERHCSVVIHEAKVDVAACEHGVRTDRYGGIG